MEDVETGDTQLTRNNINSSLAKNQAVWIEHKDEHILSVIDVELLDQNVEWLLLMDMCLL